MESKDGFSQISADYKKKLSSIFRKYDDALKPELTQVDTQPIEPETIQKATVERWTVYSFTLPVKVTKRLAFGFENKELAQEFINSHLVKKDENGEIIQKFLKDSDGNEYHVKYDTIRESVEDVDIFYNDPEITTEGNDKEEVLKAWNS